MVTFQFFQARRITRRSVDVTLLLIVRGEIGFDSALPRSSWPPGLTSSRRAATALETTSSVMSCSRTCGPMVDTSQSN